MLEWLHNIHQTLPEPVPVILAGLCIFLILEVICKTVQYVIYFTSNRYVRDQWRRSRYWEEYRALEQQRAANQSTPLPSLSRLHELESLGEG